MNSTGLSKLKGGGRLGLVLEASRFGCVCREVGRGLAVGCFDSF